MKWLKINEASEGRWRRIAESSEDDLWGEAYDIIDEISSGLKRGKSPLIALELDPYRSVLSMTYDRNKVYLDKEYGHGGAFWAIAEEGDMEQDIKQIQSTLKENGIELIVDSDAIQAAFDSAAEEEQKNRRRRDEPSMDPTFDVKCELKEN